MISLETLLGEFAIALFTEILTSCQKNNNCVLNNDSLTLSKSFLFSLKRCFVCLWALLGRRNSDHMVRKKAGDFNSYQYKQYHHIVYVCILLWGWLSPCIKELVIKWFSQKDSRSGTQNKLDYLVHEKQNIFEKTVPDFKSQVFI